MSDRRRAKIVVTVIADGDNFETHENDGEATTQVIPIAVADTVSLYRIGLACRKIADLIEDEPCIAKKEE